MLKVERQCGWCGVTTSDLERTRCEKCAGVLPGLPRRLVRTNPPVDAPAPPRALPPGYARLWYLGTGPRWLWLGLAAVLLSCTVIVPVIVAASFGAVLNFRRKAWNALVGGVPARGIVLFAAPARYASTDSHVRYAFLADSKRFEGEIWTSDPMVRHLRPGDPIAVVHLAGDPTASAPWPPLRPPEA